jgi:hypothetical protein
MEEKIEINISTENSVQSIRDVKKEMIELRSQMAQAEGQEFVNLSERASELNAKIDRTNSLVTKSGSSFTNFNTILGRTTKSLLTLDFGAAAEQAQMLQAMSKKMTFKELINGVKQATGVIKTMGKAILANPILLLAAVVVGIVVALVSLKDTIPFIQQAFDALGSAIDWIINLLKRFTDWLGLTEFAAKDAAKGIIEAEEAKVKSITDGTQEIVDNLQMEINIQQALGNSTFELEAAVIKAEKNKQKEIFKSVKRRIEALNQIKNLNEDEKAELDSLLEKEKEVRKDFAKLLNQANVLVIKNNQQKKLEDEKSALESKKIQEDYIKNRLKAQDMLAKLEIEMIGDKFERENALIKHNFNKQIEAIRTDEGLKKDEKERLINLTQDNLDRILTEREEKRNKEEELKEIEQFNQIRELKQQNRELDLERENLEFEEHLQILDERYSLELEKLKEKLENELITEEEYKLLTENLTLTHNRKLKKINSDRVDKEIADLEKLGEAHRQVEQMTQEGAIGTLQVLADAGEEGNILQKTNGLIQLGMTIAQALMSAQAAAAAAAASSGPAAPAVYASTLAGMLPGIISAGISARKAFAKAGGGGGGVNVPSVSSFTRNNSTTNINNTSPDISNFRNDLAGDVSIGGDNTMRTFILEDELTSENERKRMLEKKARF